MTDRASKKNAPKKPATSDDDFICIFAACCCFISTEVIEGTPFAKNLLEHHTGSHKPKIFSVATASEDQQHQFSPLVFKDLERFVTLFREYNEKLDKSENCKLKERGIIKRFPKQQASTFVEKLTKCGYQYKKPTTGWRDRGYTTYEKKLLFNVSPNPAKVIAVWSAIRNVLGIPPKVELVVLPPPSPFIRSRTPMQPAPPSVRPVPPKKKKKAIPRPSPTTVADTGSAAVKSGKVPAATPPCSATAAPAPATATVTVTAAGTTPAATATATAASTKTKSIPELGHRRKFDASTATAAVFVGKAAIDKNLVPSAVAHHAAAFALRTATGTKPIAKPPAATGTLGMDWDCISDLPAEVGGVAGGTATTAPPKLITLEDHGEHPPLSPFAGDAGNAFLPWAGAENDLSVPELPNVFESLPPVGAMGGALAPSNEAMDDVSACPSLNCDEADDALIPFINY